MILIITHKLDFTADYIINKLNEKGIEYKRFNCEDLFESDITIKLGTGFSYSLLGENRYDTVWFRRTMLPELVIDNLAQKQYLLKEADNLLQNLFAIIDARWISEPSAIYRAENKLFQLRMAQSLGFNIPETLVTSSKIKLREFYDMHQDVIIKPIDQTRLESDSETEFIYTSKVTKDHIAQLEHFDLTPSIFQKDISKAVELRITVVTSHVFSAQVDSQQFEESKTDWRRKKIAFTVFDLPEKLQQMCIELVYSLGLKFGAIDMILSPDGTFTFLEINPNGQWVWIETETGLKISDALIYELTKHS